MPRSREDVLDLLAALVDKSLLIVRHDGDGAAYRMLETIREYGRERLAEAGETEELRRRHAAYFVRFAERAAPHLLGAEQLELAAANGRRRDNVHMAIRAAVAAGDTDAAVGLVSGFGWYWWLRSMKKEATDLAALALRGAPVAAEAIEAQAARTRVNEAPGDGDLTWLERLATAYGMAGIVTMDSPRPVESVAWLREAEDLARWLDRPPGSAGAGPAPSPRMSRSRSTPSRRWPARCGSWLSRACGWSLA